MSLYTRLLRPLFFRFSPETAHHLALLGLKLLGFIPFARHLLRPFLRVQAPALEQTLWGLHFENPVGFAAGFDKDAEVVEPLLALGFSHVEIGTVTLQGQPGNPRPRCFRLKQDRSLINRMGLNNDGARAIAARLRRCFGSARSLDARRPAGVLGINIGKSTAVDNGQALPDQLACLELLAAHADYMVINVSCPNVKGVTSLQAADLLRPLLTGLRARLRELEPACPLLVKVSPDLDAAALAAVVEVALDCGCDGFIATNTTTGRDGLQTPAEVVEACGYGGLSGAALRRRSTEQLAQLARLVARRVPIIGVGGIEDLDSAWEKIVHGASLIQVYSGYIYSGPMLVPQINQGLQRKLAEHGFTHIDQAVGMEL